MKKGLWVLLGFVFIAVGILSIILSMVGLQFTFLTWIDFAGKLWGFLIKIIMVMAGFIIMYLNLTNWKEIH